MLRYSIFFIFFLMSCSSSFVDETQNMVTIPATITSTETGILLEWEAQWDFYSYRMDRGLDQEALQSVKTSLIPNKLMDVSVIPGRNYYYQIKALNNRDKIIGQSCIYRGNRSYRPFKEVTQPKNLTTYPDFTDRIILYWAGNYKDTFKIYRKDDKSGDFILLDELIFSANDELKFIDETITDLTHTYKIAAVGLGDNGLEEKSAQIEGSTKDGFAKTKSSKNPWRG
ncbi:MAG: hypothetical protein ACRC0X_04990 [Brevinema sp.]